MDQPLISIAIPAYKKPAFVVRVLESVIKQSYKRTEIIISDDSPDESIKIAIEPYINKLAIKYYHNQPALGSPVNWNVALNKATGDLVMLMHQDDWFNAADALDTFVGAFKANKSLDFIFCQNTAIQETGEKTVLQGRPSLLNSMSKHPNHLLLAQVIGPPSNTILKKHVDVQYDERFVWLVDVDYYVRILKKGYQYHYIEKHLVSIGLHEDQTTNFCRADGKIILKENIWFAYKLEQEAFKDILIFDYYWRLLRNYGVRTVEDLKHSGVAFHEIPGIIIHIIKMQQKVPLPVLKFGPFSKTLMLICYLLWNK